MDIAIVGAGGVIGRQVATALVQRRLPGPGGRLQLIGRADGPSAALLPGMGCDLRDAYGEELPEIDLSFRIDSLRADVVIMAAGQTVTGEPGAPRLRSELAERNRDVVERTAAVMAANGSGDEVLLVLTNPVEVMVDAACGYLDRHRVIGLGAVLDTLRFRQEIAAELGIRRSRVDGVVLGEHGPGMLPCWSTVAVHGLGREQAHARIAGLRRPPPWPDVATIVAEIERCVRRDGVAAAYAAVDGFDAAWRTWLRPWVTQLSTARTPVGTAAAIVNVISALSAGGQVLTAAQVQVRGEFLDLHTTTGVPVVLSRRGLERITALDLSGDEVAALRSGSGLSGLRALAPAIAETATAVPEWLLIITVGSGERPGVIARIAGIFAERGLNIDGIVAGQRLGQPTVVVDCRAPLALRDHVISRLNRDAQVAGIVCEAAAGRRAWNLFDADTATTISTSGNGW